MSGISFRPFYNRIGYPGQIGKRHDDNGMLTIKELELVHWMN